MNCVAEDSDEEVTRVVICFRVVMSSFMEDIFKGERMKIWIKGSESGVPYKMRYALYLSASALRTPQSIPPIFIHLTIRGGSSSSPLLVFGVGSFKS